jgi:hypothetical protein
MCGYILLICKRERERERERGELYVATNHPEALFASGLQPGERVPVRVHEKSYGICKNWKKIKNIYIMTTDKQI